MCFWARPESLAIMTWRVEGLCARSYNYFIHLGEYAPAFYLSSPEIEVV